MNRSLSGPQSRSASFWKREGTRPNRSYRVGTFLNRDFPNFLIVIASSPKGRVAKEIQNSLCTGDELCCKYCHCCFHVDVSGWALFRLSDSAWFLMCLSAGIPEHVMHSWHPECTHSNQSIPVTSFRKVGPHVAASADSFFQLLPWPLCKTILLYEPFTTSLFLQLFFVVPFVHCPCSFQVRTSLSMTEGFFLRVCPITYISAVWYARPHRSSFEISLDQRIWNISLFCKRLWWSV